jgi:hypothetical protein
MQTSKDAAKNASDLEYKKGIENLATEYRGYQSLDPAEHPVVKAGKKAKEITSDIPYRQEYEDEKALIYYPVHISEGYESQAKLKKDMGNYKADYEGHKEKNYFKFSDTETYGNMKKSAQLVDRVYQADYQNTKHQNMGIPETAEMTLAKSLKPTQSKTLYAHDAKEDMKKGSLPEGAVEIAHAQDSQKLASKNTYKEDWVQNVQGKGRTDPEDLNKAFPEHVHHRAVAATISNYDYPKDAKKIMNECRGIPEDAAIFKLAKENNANLSDLSYHKDLKEVNESMRGYQTMDPSTHPVITEGNKKKDLLSDKPYHAEWEEEKWMVYYPVHITEGYDSVANLKRKMRDYKADYEAGKEKVNYRYSETDEYQNKKKGLDLVDVSV